MRLFVSSLVLDLIRNRTPQGREEVALGANRGAGEDHTVPRVSEAREKTTVLRSSTPPGLGKSGTIYILHSHIQA